MQQSELILSPTELLSSSKHSSTSLSDIKINVDEQNHATNTKDCWICYDRDKDDIFIEPCRCKGDMSRVHRECLKRWLMQNLRNKLSRCEICKCEYNIVCKNKKLKWKNGLTTSFWIVMAVTIVCICLAVAGCWTLVYLYDNYYIRILCVNVALLIVYVSLRFLGRNILHAYRRAKVVTLNIGNRIAEENMTDSAPSRSTLELSTTH